MKQRALHVDDLYIELSEEGFGHAFRVRAELHAEQSPYQHVRVLDTTSHGRLMLLDDLVMLTQRDEFIYHEMLAHVPLMAHPAPEQVLVIGGGDGGTLREVLRHPGVKRAVLCEIDERVIEVSKRWFPEVASAFDHPRAEVVVGDGVAYLAGARESFDVVLVDSTDPVGFAEGLFGAEFLHTVKGALRPGGIYASQHESPFLDRGATLRGLRRALDGVFAHTGTYWASVPVYPYGLWTFALASETPWRDRTPDPARTAAIEAGCRYWTPALQHAAFALPAFVRDLVQPRA